MRKTLILLIVQLVVLDTFSQMLPSKSNVVSQMKLANNYWISQNTDPGNNQWARAVYFAGNIEFYKIYPQESYLRYAELWAKSYNWGLNGGTSTRNADNQTCGQAYIDMYLLDTTKLTEKINAIKASVDNMAFNSKADDWSWIDALFMAMPVFVKIGNLTGDLAYTNKMYALYTNTKITRGLYNESEGLWYRDESFKPPYLTANGQDCYWSRGNGWVIAAHARILNELPLNDVHRVEYSETFLKMAAALKLRQRTDGFWNASLDDPLQYNGPETSGTAFFTYALAWGINHQVLDSAEYYPVVQKAWNALTATALQPSGFLGYVQGVGSSPALAFAGTTQDFAVGAFLLAGTEVVKLAEGSMPQPSNFYSSSVTAQDKNHIAVNFSKKIDKSTALDPLNYAIDNQIDVIKAESASNDSSVILTVTSLAPSKYTLKLSGISAENGQLIEEGESRSFTYTGIYSITASGYESGTSNTPGKCIDYDFSTRWSVEGKGQWIVFYLGDEKTVESLDAAFYNGASRKAYFTINLSSDGNDYTEVMNCESSSKTSDLENYDFPDQKAKYVKLIMNGNSASLWNSITELRLNALDDVSGLSSYTQSESGKLLVYPQPYKGGSLYLANTLGQTSRVSILPRSKGIYFITLKNESTRKVAKLLVE
jgi:rhamnogalacturonyl hydrolase YesR